MCRGANLGTCIAVGCDTKIRCQDTCGYCDAHDWQNAALCYCDGECVCPPSKERPAVDTEKQRLYRLNRLDAAIPGMERSLGDLQRRLGDAVALRNELRSVSS